MAQNPDFKLELNPKKVAQPRSFDLGIDFDATPKQRPYIPNIPTPSIPVTSNSTQAVMSERPVGGKFVLPSVGKEVVQGTARGAAITGAYGAARLQGTPKEQASQYTITPQNLFERKIFGEQPFSVQSEAIQPLIQMGASEPAAQKYGPPLLIALTALDAATGPGKRKALQEGLAAAKTSEKVVSLLQKEGFTNDVIFGLKLDEKLVDAQTPNAVNLVLESARNQVKQEVAPTRKFTINNPPKAKSNETVVYFERTPAGDIQYVSTDPGVTRRFATSDNAIEAVVVPSKSLRTTGDVGKDRAGIRTITSELADQLVAANRVEQPSGFFTSALNNLRNPAMRQGGYIGQAPDSFPKTKLQPESLVDDNTVPLPKTAAPRTPEAVLGRTPSPMQTIRAREATLLRNKLRDAQTVSRRAAVATRKDVKEIQDQMVQVVSDLPLKERGKFIATIKNIQTPQQLKRALPDFERRVNTALEKVAEQEQRKALRNQVRAMISQKRLVGAENLRKSLQLPSLNRMTVDDLRTFARTLAPYKPGDRFLSQRILETIDRTNLSGMKTYREVREKLAKEAGVPIEDLRKINVSWMDKFRYDTALARQNPFYDVVVKKINGSLVEGNIRFAQFEDEFDDLLRAARKSQPRSLGERLVPTDERIFKYIEAENKADLVDELTPEELKAANFLIDRYQDAKEYLLREKVMDKYIEDYVTHIRRSGLEAYRQDGLISAIKETFEQYRVDQANFNVLNEKTGDVLPLEKFFAFAQKRTGGLKPSQNIGRASKAYFQAFERKRALDAIVPELQAYASAVTPTKKTAKGLDFDPRVKTFLKTYINNKRGRPAALLFNPGSPPDVIMRGVTSVTRLIDLGLSLPNFAAANVGEQTAVFIGQGTKQYARGIRRMNTAQGKKIIEKYRGFVGRSPWSEIRDTSKNFPDKMMTLMLSGFHDASVRANKQGLLGALSSEEFTSGTISPERLAQIRNEMGRWRALDNSASIIGSTGEGKIFTQYKAWAVPILSSTLDNITNFTKTTARGSNPFTTQAGQELLRETVVVGTVALATYAYFNQEDDTFIGQMINKSVRDALSAIGALDPEMWISTPRAWQYVQDLESALRSLVMLEEYKSGEEAGTFKGDDQLLRLVTPAPVRQVKNALGSDSSTASSTTDFELDFGDFDTNTGPDFELDFDLGI